jgi:hypothetical protein
MNPKPWSPWSNTACRFGSGFGIAWSFHIAAIYSVEAFLVSYRDSAHTSGGDHKSARFDSPPSPTGFAF